MSKLRAAAEPAASSAEPAASSDASAEPAAQEDASSLVSDLEAILRLQDSHLSHLRSPAYPRSQGAK